jgi:hypothetical protein
MTNDDDEKEKEIVIRMAKKINTRIDDDRCTISKGKF